MCKKLSEGGVRCAAHTRGPGMTALTVMRQHGPAELTSKQEQDLIDYATTREGRTLLTMEANKALPDDFPGDPVEQAAYLEHVVAQGLTAYQVAKAVQSANHAESTTGVLIKDSGEGTDEFMVGVVAPASKQPAYAMTAPPEPLSADLSELLNITGATVNTPDAAAPALWLEDTVEAAALAMDAAAALRDASAEIATAVAQRLKTAGIKTATDPHTGLSVSPGHDKDVTGWQHDKIRDHLVNHIEATRNIPAATARAIIDDYTTYASIAYYRPSALNDIGVDVSTVGTVKWGELSLRIRNEPYQFDAPTPSAVQVVHANRDMLSTLRNRTPLLAKKIAAMPIDQAIREAVAVDHLRRRMSTVANAAAERAHDAMTTAKFDTMTTAYGTFKPHTTAASEKWDPQIETILAEQIAKDTSAPVPTIAAVLFETKAVMAVSQYKKKGLRAANIEPAEWFKVSPGNKRLKLVPPEPAATA